VNKDLKGLRGYISLLSASKVNIYGIQNLIIMPTKARLLFISIPGPHSIFLSAKINIGTILPPTHVSQAAVSLFFLTRLFYVFTTFQYVLHTLSISSSISSPYFLLREGNTLSDHCHFSTHRLPPLLTSKSSQGVVSKQSKTLFAL
jgi:hypothetical protein